MHGTGKVTAAVAFAPRFPLLSAVLFVVSVASCARSTCLLAVFLVTRRQGMFPGLLGWQGASLGVVSAFLVSGGAWQYGAVTGGVSCAALWARAREARPGKSETAPPPA